MKIEREKFSFVSQNGTEKVSEAKAKEKLNVENELFKDLESMSKVKVQKSSSNFLRLHKNV